MNELGPGMKANVGSSGKRKHRSVTLSGEIFFFFEFFKKIQEKFMLQFQDVKILSLCSRNDDLSIKVASLTGKYRIIFTQGSTLLRQNN